LPIASDLARRAKKKKKGADVKKKDKKETAALITARFCGTSIKL